MKRHLIWIVTGASALVLAVPAFAAVQSDGSPDDDGPPGEVRGNCDEAEHANDPECVTVDAPASTFGTIAATTAPTTAPSTVPTSVSTIPAGTVPGSTVASGTVPGATVPNGSVPNASVPTSSSVTSLPGDISGPCDEAEHADDPRCTGAAVDTDDNSGPGNGHDDQDDDHGGDDDGDRSGHGGGGDDGGSDDNSGHGSD